MLEIKGRSIAAALAGPRSPSPDAPATVGFGRPSWIRFGDKIPEFNRRAPADEPGIAAVGLGLGESRTHLEAAIIALVAVVIVGGAEALLRIFNVPQYIMPKPSQIIVALFTDWPFLWPHLITTLYELFTGFAIGGAIGFVMAAVITQFPFVEKIVTPASGHDADAGAGAPPHSPLRRPPSLSPAARW